MSNPNSTPEPVIVWFREDLRIEDQPALNAAIQSKAPIIPLYIWAPKEAGNWPPGSATKWWLHHSLVSLESDLAQAGLRLIIRHGPSLDALSSIIHETGATSVFWNRCYTPASILRDTLIKSELHRKEVTAKSFNGSLLFEPWTILNKQKKPFQVFTYYWKECIKTEGPSLPSKNDLKAVPFVNKIASASIHSLDLLPKIPWDKGLAKSWAPGEKNAKIELERTINFVIPHYLEQRDIPSKNGTSRLSPYLHFGEISPCRIWQSVISRKSLDPLQSEAFLRQLGWREFGHYLLYHFPDTPELPLHRKFAELLWKNDHEGLKAWQKGLTGYPIIDAGMRQLWRTGWMHNRVRMLVGSFLVKDLLIPWQEGEKWFWDTLVDADLANNTLGWQWVGGCGADAAPYFRIFNPVLQGEKFDPAGEYVKKWVPELQSLPIKWLHKPWEAPAEILRHAGITLGVNYPHPIVDHNQARLRALEAFSGLNKID